MDIDKRCGLTTRLLQNRREKDLGEGKIFVLLNTQINAEKEIEFTASILIKDVG